MLAQVIFALLSLLLYRLLAEETGKDGFGSYALVKQSVAFAYPIVMVGLVAGLPRYLARPSDQPAPTAEAYLLAALAICGGATASVALLAVAFPEATAELVFGSSSRAELVPPFSALLAASSLFYLVYGYFRGQLRMRLASALQVGAFALPPPLIVLAFRDEPIAALIALMALSLALASLCAICAPLVRAFKSENRRWTGEAAAVLWRYGPRRVPGDVAQIAVFVLVPLLGAHLGSLNDVANLTAGQQIFAVLSLAIQPLGLVLLPSLSRLMASDRERAANYVGQLAGFAAHVAIFLSFQTVIYADIAVTIWLGSAFEDAASVVRVTVAPAALYVVYLMLRSSLDAAAVRSYNSRNNVIALAVFGAVAALLLSLDATEPVLCVAWAFAAGATTQGVLAFVSVHRLFGLKISDYDLSLAAPLGLATGALGLAARPLVADSGVQLPLLLALELTLALGYFGLLVRSRPGWVALLRERFFEARR